jgi:hypothetical protein
MQLYMYIVQGLCELRMCDEMPVFCLTLPDSYIHTYVCA